MLRRAVRLRLTPGARPRKLRRSYVVTFAFVTFRITQEYIIPGGLGMEQGEFLALLSWTCWAVPL